MTDTAPPSQARPGSLEVIASLGCAIVFLLALAGLARALSAHAPLPPAFGRAAVLAHFATVMSALPLAISQLLLPKGTLRHRVVGYVWCALMLVTALASFSVREISPGHLSLIHVFSVVTLVAVPVLIWNARTHHVARHRRTVLGLVIGGLVVAGLLTFVPGRALGALVSGLFPH